MKVGVVAYSTDLTEEMAIPLLEMANYYQVVPLVSYCAEYLDTVINEDNACVILSYALLYNLQNLKRACCLFIDNNARAVVNSNAFLDLPRSCLAYILKGDTLLMNEKELFLRAEQWAIKKVTESGSEVTGNSIRSALGEGFRYLRLPTLKLPTLMDCTRGKDYLTAKEYEEFIDYHNKQPNTIVSSNSCVQRIPISEVFQPNAPRGEYGDPEKEINISFGFSLGNKLYTKLGNR